MQSKHRIAALILREGDALLGSAEQMGIPVALLPPDMTLPYRSIREKLQCDETVQGKINRWVEGLKDFQPDVGVVFYGYWIPPVLYTMPRLGFLNYHPAPLPDLRGMEPDTLAILQGRESMCGTVHQVSLNYDDGPILAYTPRIRLTRYTTPQQIFETLTRYATRTIVRVLDRLARGKAEAVPQSEHHAQDATRKRARQESSIRWHADTVDMIERRRRAFLGQDIGIRLKADVGGTVFAVDDLESHAGLYPGKPGKVIGVYGGEGPFHGCPIVRAKDGVAVLRLGSPVPSDGARAKEPPAPRILPPGRRAKQTHRATVQRSVRAGSGQGR